MATAEYNRARYAERLNAGLCTKCGSRRDKAHNTRIVSQGLCRYHLAKAHVTTRKRTKRRYEESKRLGRCTQCHQVPARVGYITCQRCGDYVAMKGYDWYIDVGAARRKRARNKKTPSS